MHDLAIVIPAYKEAFLYASLQSLARQTNKNFTVYIGDDCSPFELKKIASQFSDVLNIVYERFPFNTGAKNLVNQWKRCIGLTQHEKWLWLFSDDDIAGENCVEAFFAALYKNGDRYDVYRFVTSVIDNHGSISHGPLPGPTEERSEEMAYNLLLGKRGNSMPDHIFSRKVYQESGGFVFTNYAQSADWATSILFSQAKGMFVIQDAMVFWRLSGQNLSSVSRNNRGEMIQGYIYFLEWIDAHFEYLDNSNDTKITRQMIKSASWINFSNVMRQHYKGFGLKDLSMLIRFLHAHFCFSKVRAARELFAIQAAVTSLKTRIRLSIIKRFILSGGKHVPATN